MKIINLTPHTIHLPGIDIEPSGKVARCKEDTVIVGNINNIKLIHRDYKEVYDLLYVSENQVKYELDKFRKMYLERKRKQVRGIDY